jgi:hypothetical protein
MFAYFVDPVAPFTPFDGYLYIEVSILRQCVGRFFKA